MRRLVSMYYELHGEEEEELITSRVYLTKCMHKMMNGGA